MCHNKISMLNIDLLWEKIKMRKNESAITRRMSFPVFLAVDVQQEFYRMSLEKNKELIVNNVKINDELLDVLIKGKVITQASINTGIVLWETQ